MRVFKKTDEEEEDVEEEEENLMKSHKENNENIMASRSETQAPKKSSKWKGIKLILNIDSIDSDSDIILNDDNVENVSSSGSSCKFYGKTKIINFTVIFSCWKWQKRWARNFNRV